MKFMTYFVLLALTLSSTLYSCKEECPECPEQSDEKIIVDEVDTALVKKADNIIVDEVDTAYVKNAKYIIVENAENAYFENAGTVVFSGKSGYIIVDEVDTAMVAEPQPEHPLQRVVDDVRTEDDDEEDDEDNK